MPSGIPYIIGNEAAERYSFYGMKAILVVFMTKYLMDGGDLSPMREDDATKWFHLFNSAVYFTPLLGAIVADAFLGKYKTIVGLSIVYCLGHLALALDESRVGLTIGLTLIAIGAGGIKPCVSAHVGDQFGKSNGHMLTKVFGWFYFSINLGAFASQIFTPLLLEWYGPQVAFGVPGGLMLLATVVFWMGRREFVHIPAGGSGFLRDTFSREGFKIIGRLCVIYLFVAVFWALFDQSGSKWVLQADRMDRNWLGVEWLPSQINAINPVMIMVFIPIFTWLVYPTINKFFPLTPLRKIGIGFFVAVPSFLIPAWIETQINDGELPNIIWQLLAYVFLTAAEVFISITALEFSYTQAPRKMKSLVLGFFLMSVSLGNLFTAGVNHFIRNEVPSFVPDAQGDYVLKLEVGDGESIKEATTLISVGPEKIEPGFFGIAWDFIFTREEQSKSEKDHLPIARKSPKADAGRLRVVSLNERVRMYGTASKGDFSGPFAYQWKFLNVPQGSSLGNEQAGLQESGTRNAYFSPDAEGEYELEFRVTVGDEKGLRKEGNSTAGGEASHMATDTVKIVVSEENFAPHIKFREENATVSYGQTVKLDASGSFDPNGDEMTFEWTFESMPAESKLNSASITGGAFGGPSSKLGGASYYLFFAGLMLLAALVFVPVAMAYEPKDHLQE
jgi:POT family proton-dependent oligopeptide transporter